MIIKESTFIIRECVGFCACGCGKKVEGKQKKYATKSCYWKVYDKANPCRGIKQGITSRYERALKRHEKAITWDQLEFFKRQVEELYKDGKTGDEIKAIIYKEYDKFIKASQ